MEARDKPLVTRGTFRGYAAVGPHDAICIELDSSHQELAGKIRLIPVHMIVSIDVVEAVPEKDEPEGSGTMYG